MLGKFHGFDRSGGGGHCQLLRTLACTFAKAVFFFLLLALYRQHSSLLNNWTASLPAISPLRRRWRAKPRGGQPVQGHLDGGRACLLAMRVSRSVLLSVCEAVIRFQDFPSVTGLLTKPYTPQKTTTATWPSPLPPPPEPLSCYTSAGRSDQSPAAAPESPPHSN